MSADRTWPDAIIAEKKWLDDMAAKKDWTAHAREYIDRQNEEDFPLLDEYMVCVLVEISEKLTRVLEAISKPS